MSKYKIPPADKVYPQAIRKSLVVFLSAALPVFVLCADYSDKYIELTLIHGLLAFLVAMLIIIQPFFTSYKYINIVRYSLDDEENEPEAIGHFEKLINIFHKAAIFGLMLPLIAASFFPVIKPYAIFYPVAFMFLFLFSFMLAVGSEVERYGSSHFFHLVENMTGKSLFASKSS